MEEVVTRRRGSRQANTISGFGISLDAKREEGRKLFEINYDGHFRWRRCHPNKALGDIHTHTNAQNE